jgi:hypothetical protein
MAIRYCRVCAWEVPTEYIIATEQPPGRRPICSRCRSAQLDREARSSLIQLLVLLIVGAVLVWLLFFA